MQLDSAKLFCFDLIRGSLQSTAEAIIQSAQANQKTIINFLNAHCVNIAVSDAEYRKSLHASTALLPDGSGMSIAAKLANVRLGENLNGTDLFPILCEQAAKSGQSIYLHGGEPTVAAQAARNMQQRYPELEVAGVSNGFEEHTDTANVISQINSSGADLVFIGLGVPLQEKWIAAHRSQIDAPVILGVGGLFDYYSGRIPRAPKLLRSIGMEWSWRLLQEPRRLAKRYLAGNISFLAKAIVNGWNARGLKHKIFVTNKRALDLTLTLLGLVFIGPLFAAISLLILAEDRGPVFFRQVRIGKDGKPFKMWKFRSMAVDAEQRLQQLAAQSDRDDVCFKMKNDPRITKIGKLIRRFSMDELPQLVNVLKGDMSLVGPRPALPKEVMQKPDKSINRLAGKPGLTCTWQVSGRAEIPFEEQVRMDEEYLCQQSVLKDISLLVSTVPAILTGRGAY
ncbi:MAG: WecB/TagA/CpsF family glycosyltransferase [Parasphingorhabdus sp.]